MGGVARVPTRVEMGKRPAKPPSGWITGTGDRVSLIHPAVRESKLFNSTYLDGPFANATPPCS